MGPSIPKGKISAMSIKFEKDADEDAYVFGEH